MRKNTLSRLEFLHFVIPLVNFSRLFASTFLVAQLVPNYSSHTQNSLTQLFLCKGKTKKAKIRFLSLLMLITAILPLQSCSLLTKIQVNAQARQKKEQEDNIPAVDLTVARMGILATAITGVGTTQPIQEISLRSRVEGQLISLPVKVGDKVSQGQILARLDDSLLATQVAQAQAELAALHSEVVKAKAEVSDAHTQLERARAELEQAKNEAVRYTDLLDQGAIAQQEAESRQTAAKIAEQAVFSAQQQVKTAQQAVEAAMGRVGAQKAVVSQTQQRQGYTRLVATINGVITERSTEAGNLVRTGDEVLKLVDLTSLKVEVPVSELDLEDLYVGQSVEVKLDAFPEQTFSGTLHQIAPLADSSTRKVPVQVIITNPEEEISSGLLARVKFTPEVQPRVIVPESAIQGDAGGSEAVFLVVSQPTEENLVKVEKHLVTTGDRANGKVEIISGIEPGDRFVVSSTKPLSDGDSVRLSILSEKN